MPTVVQVALEPLREATFRPFGRIVGVDAEPPAVAFDGMHTWKAPFDADGAAEMTICRYFRQPIAWSRMERHLAVTQAFLPLAGVETALVVAPPTDPTQRDALPPPDSVRAFHMDGSVGVLLWRGTWHALRRFPLRAAHADIVLLTGRATQDELEQQAAGGPLPALTHEADYAALQGVTFRLANPA